MVTQKLVDILPDSPMPRSVLRSFGVERNVVDQTDGMLFILSLI